MRGLANIALVGGGLLLAIAWYGLVGAGVYLIIVSILFQIEAATLAKIAKAQQDAFEKHKEAIARDADEAIRAHIANRKRAQDGGE